MTCFDHFTSDSPVLTMSAQPAHQPPLDMSGFASQQAPSGLVSSRPPQPAPEAMHRPAASAGRKRSRDEASANLEPDPLPTLPSPEPEEDWVYGEGMVLIKPDRGYVADASTQSGTWIEENQSSAKQIAMQQAEAQSLDYRSHKAQRVDLAHYETLPPQDMPQAPPGTATSAPVIDDFTIHLGIGWRKLSEDEHIQAAARGWARYIENHYPLSNVSIRLESKGLQSFLIESCEGFFLFAEDLRHGRLVSQSVEGALRNLQSTPPTFDGVHELSAAESSQPMTSQPDSFDLDGGMEMD